MRAVLIAQCLSLGWGWVYEQQFWGPSSWLNLIGCAQPCDSYRAPQTKTNLKVLDSLDTAQFVLWSPYFHSVVRDSSWARFVSWRVSGRDPFGFCSFSLCFLTTLFSRRIAGPWNYCPRPSFLLWVVFLNTSNYKAVADSCLYET